MKIQKMFREVCSVLLVGRQNIAPGDSSASVAVAYGMKAELASLKVGYKMLLKFFRSMEMANNDLGILNDIDGAS